ncbi:type VII secretion-associated serine protease mycosin [Saccharomonospora saliphila]|uniref:type VII secretion-associated serine protease mycosin n=1 Tax=Saccharomonospora saliphila TaxID=369829 RepID=UPI0003604504|nr:type VII secretion-associated serine protease mycosin [Saccharomonospora saliphila]
MRKGSALALVLTLGVGGPALVPPAAAQDAEDDGGYYATPPPVDNSLLPPDTGGPDENYEKRVQCVQRNLEYNEQIQNAPWGQRFLRIGEVHSLMRSTLGSAGKGPDGKPIRVAVIDTGVTAHPYFQDRVRAGGDYVDDAGNGLEDCDGHGTQVAGIIAADTPRNIGFTGVAPDAEIVSIRQSSQNYSPQEEESASSGDDSSGDSGSDSDSGSGGGGSAGAPADSDEDTAPAQGGRTQGEGAGTLSTLAQAIRGAADDGVDVMNISINHCRPADGGVMEDERRLQAAIRHAVNNDVVVVSAAGNLSERCEQNDQASGERVNTIVTPPWFAEDVLSVAAIDETGGVADFSIHGPWVSVAAPGTGIISLDPAEGSDGLANMMIENGEPAVIKGTSFAAPYVAGLAALVRAKYPNLDAREVMHRIEFTAHHPAAPGGRDNYVGHGVINPMAALTATVPSEEGLPAARAEALPSDMPPPAERNWTPMIVALVGSGGALTALLVTLFVVHTLRRTRAQRRG